MKFLTSGLFLLLFFINIPIPEYFCQQDSLRLEIEKITESFNGKAGVAVIKPKTNDILTYNGDDKFPMQSVYKFHLALAVLDKVDNGKLSLEQKIFVRKSDLLTDTWSPLREKYPEGNVYVSLDELLNFTVSQSDNNGCDILFRLIGGPKKVEQYIHSLGISDVAISATEEEMHEDWEVQFTNWSTPAAMAELLAKFRKEDILSQSSKEYLWNVMVNTVTGAGRIKGLLPEEAVVAHKTGSSGSDENGVTAATNDAGIIEFPGGTYCVIVVFVSDSTEDYNTQEGIIAKISKAVWDNYTKDSLPD